MLSLSQLLRRFAPGAKVAPSPTGTKIQVKQMLEGRCARGIIEAN